LDLLGIGVAGIGYHLQRGATKLFLRPLRNLGQLVLVRDVLRHRVVCNQPMAIVHRDLHIITHHAAAPRAPHQPRVRVGERHLRELHRFHQRQRLSYIGPAGL